jgi:AAA domain
LSKHLCQQAGCDLRSRYLSWDAAEDREKILSESFPSGPGFLILDEIHKYSRWRQMVKGLFDKRGDELQILVTGSARLDHYRRGGYSLQGRYHFYRLLPLTCAELGAASASTCKGPSSLWGFPRAIYPAIGNRDAPVEPGIPVKGDPRGLIGSGESAGPGSHRESGRVAALSECVECKIAERDPTVSLKYLKRRFPAMSAVQVVLEKDLDLMTKEGIRICSAHRFLKDLI